MRDIMLSLKPYWAELIYSGKKTVEWRKSSPDTGEGFRGRRIYIYETSPVKMVTGFCHLHSIYEFNRPIELKKDSDAIKAGCVPYEDLLKYQDNRKLCAWCIASFIKFDRPYSLADFHLDRPPQSWQYLRERQK